MQKNCIHIVIYRTFQYINYKLKSIFLLFRLLFFFHHSLTWRSACREHQIKNIARKKRKERTPAVPSAERVKVTRRAPR